MVITTYLFVSNKGAVRVNKTGAGVKSNELALKVVLDVPNAFFARPVPVVKIDVPIGLLSNLSPDAAVELSAPEVARVLGVSVEAASDGLLELVRKWSES